MSCGSDPLLAARRLRNENPDTALACYDQALRQTPDAGLYFEQAALAHAVGRVAVLERSLRESVRMLPTFGDGYYELANALHSQARFPEAVTSFNVALDQNVGDPGMTLNNLANTLSELGDNTGAKEAYARGLRLAPASGFLLNGLANLQSAAGRDEEAVVTIQRALRAQPTAHYAAFNMGNFMRRLKRYPEAEETYRRALAAQPRDARYEQGLGTILHEVGRADEAVTLYLAARARLRRAGAARSGELERDLASALREAGRLGEAARAARGAVALEPRRAEGYMALAAALREAGRVGEASVHAQLEATLDVEGLAQRASEAEREAVARALAERRGAARRLAIFCRRVYSGERADGTWHWGPHAKRSGIGGSESAVISMSAELAALGWRVEVYANPSAADTGVDARGVLWLPHWAYAHAGAPPEVFVAWRFSEAAAVGRRAALRFLWLHDEVRAETVPPPAVPLLHGIMVLSAFHGAQLPAHAAPLELRTANGLDAAAIRDGANDADAYIYASSASAGLLLLLELWPQVRAARPRARLDVYYGFWPYAMWAEQPALRALRAQIEPLLRQPGVRYHGMVSEEALADAYAAAGWYAYPSDKPETSGIALMKAMACGAVPLTSGQLASALPETVGEWDLGPARRHGTIATDAAWQRDYVAALLAAARRPAAAMAAFRQRMKAEARRRFRWAAVARQWDAHFGALLAGGRAQAGRPPRVAAPAVGDGAAPAPPAHAGAHDPAPAAAPARKAAPRPSAATVFFEVDMAPGQRPEAEAGLDFEALLHSYHELREGGRRLRSQVRALEQTLAWLQRESAERAELPLAATHTSSSS